MDDQRLLEARINHLHKWRKAICQEFEDWPGYYTTEWFVDQLKQIDRLITKLTSKK